jgi:tellurite resistance protein
MADRDLWDERRRSYESEYFQRSERELIEKMRARTRELAEVHELREGAGIADDEILKALHDLGYTRETVTLVHLVPLLHVAWIDGSVSAAERAGILEAARLRGVEESTPAHRQLVSWLDKKPLDGFFEDTLRLIGNLLSAMPDAERVRARTTLLAFALATAEASGGILGLGGKVSDEERAVIDRIAREIEAAHGEAAKQVVR